MIFAYSTLPYLINPGHESNSSSASITLMNGKGSKAYHPCDGNCTKHGYCAPISCACDEYWGGDYCQVSLAWNVKGVALIHGVMMYIAFGFLYPIGIAWVRYSRPGKRRIVVHQTIQGTTSMFLIAALVLAIVLVYASRDIAIIVQHTPHPIIGLIIIVLLFLQLLYNSFIPMADKQTIIAQVFHLIHPWIGRTLLILGWINCFVGIYLLQGMSSFFYTHIAVISFWFIIFIILEIRKFVSGKSTYSKISS